MRCRSTGARYSPASPWTCSLTATGFFAAVLHHAELHPLERRTHRRESPGALLLRQLRDRNRSPSTEVEVRARGEPRTRSGSRGSRSRASGCCRSSPNRRWGTGSAAGPRSPAPGRAGSARGGPDRRAAGGILHPSAAEAGPSAAYPNAVAARSPLRPRSRRVRSHPIRARCAGR